MRHGLSETRLYKIYSGMKQRCCNKKAFNYLRYGGRGIYICDEWLGENGFENFYKWAMENEYSDNLTIDRIDVDKGYSPENCQWLTLSENCSRKRLGHHVRSGIEPVSRNVIIGRARNKSENNDYINYKISLPAEMIKELGVTQEDKGVLVDFVDGKIVIEKAVRE